MNSIPEFAALFFAARSISVFIKGHKYITVRFKKIIGTHEKMLVLYPDTRFAYADLTVQRVIENQVNLGKLIDDPAWAELEKGVNKTSLVAFKSHINSPLLFEKFSSMRAVT